MVKINKDVDNINIFCIESFFIKYKFILQLKILLYILRLLEATLEFRKLYFPLKVIITILL